MNETQTAQEKLAEVVAALVAALNVGWKVASLDQSETFPGRYSITRADGADMRLTLSFKIGFPRISLWGIMPTGPDNFHRSARDYGVENVDVAVSASRPTPVIVNDLLRRGVTSYLASYSIAAAKRAEEQRGIEATEALGVRLAALLDVKVTPRDNRWQSDKTPTFSRYARTADASSVERVEVTVRDGAAVDISLSAVPADFAEKVLQLLRPRYLEEKSSQGD